MNKRNMKSFVFLIFKTSIFEHKVYVEILKMLNMEFTSQLMIDITRYCNSYDRLYKIKSNIVPVLYQRNMIIQKILL